MLGSNQLTCEAACRLAETHAAELLAMPSVTSRIGDHGDFRPAQSRSDQGQTGISECRSRSQGLPYADGHRRGTDAENRSRPIAKDESSDRVQVHSELCEAGKESGAWFIGARDPAVAAIGLAKADLHPEGCRVDDQDGRMVTDDFGETGHHAGNDRASARASAQRGESGIDRERRLRRVPDSTSKNPSPTLP